MNLFAKYRSRVMNFRIDQRRKTIDQIRKRCQSLNLIIIYSLKKTFKKIINIIFKKNTIRKIFEQIKNRENMLKLCFQSSVSSNYRLIINF